MTAAVPLTLRRFLFEHVTRPFVRPASLANRPDRAAQAARAYRRREQARLERVYVADIANDPCCYCGDIHADERDHIVPVRGRSRSADADLFGWQNVTPACGRCNRKKGALSLLMFLVRRRVAEGVNRS